MELFACGYARQKSFDLPGLKIAALHSPHQITRRDVRVSSGREGDRSNLGRARFLCALESDMEIERESSSTRRGVARKSSQNRWRRVREETRRGWYLQSFRAEPRWIRKRRIYLSIHKPLPPREDPEWSRR